ncbi:MAG TPA: ATP-binding protein [Nocardioides sp.]|uniref:ATP-binding protein n=1 Tax=Nocardioides sp. TaxID=35761 RepID=UPI002F430263
MDAALPNPYTPGEVPRVLAGRRTELGRIRDQLGRVGTFGEIGGPMLVFHAPRGLGKTSLLRAAQRDAEESGFVTAWVACSRQRPFLPELVRAVARALERAEVVPADESARWHSRLDRIGLQLGVPGVRVTGEIARTPPAEPTSAAPIAALEDLLHDAATRVRSRGGAGLLVFVDELHAASADDMSVLLNAWQNLAGDREHNPLALVTAGLPVTPEALTRAATFGERSAFVALDVLDEPDARAALVEPARASEVSWTEDALDRIVGEARGYPYFLQLMGSTTWSAAAPGTGDTIGLAEVEAGLPRAGEQLTAMYRARWGAATEKEQAFLSAMAAAGTDNVTRAQIATALGQDTRSISVPRERLIEKGVIEPVGHGLVRFTMPGFGAYVRARTG